MKMKFGEIVTDGRGKLGGNVNYKTKYGNIVRNKVTNVNTLRTSQQQQRNFFSFVARTWRTLTPQQCTDWNNLAANTPFINEFGDTYFLSGFNMFQVVNTQRVRSNLPIQSTPNPSSTRPVITDTSRDLPFQSYTLNGEDIRFSDITGRFTVIYYASDRLPITSAEDYSLLREVSRCQYQPVSGSTYDISWQLFGWDSLGNQGWSGEEYKVLVGLEAFNNDNGLLSQRFTGYFYNTQFTTVQDFVTIKSIVSDPMGDPLRIRMQGRTSATNRYITVGGAATNNYLNRFDPATGSQFYFSIPMPVADRFDNTFDAGDMLSYMGVPPFSGKEIYIVVAMMDDLGSTPLGNGGSCKVNLNSGLLYEY